MSIPRHHAEWLSLIEVSGPFLSLPVLQRAFPQGLEPHEPERARLLRLAYDEWQDAVESRRNVAPLHYAWIEFVLTRLLQLPGDLVLTGQAIPPTLVAHVPEHHETLRPNFVLADPADAARPRLLVQVYPPGQHLDKPVAGHTWKASPATRMMDLLHAANVRLGLVADGERWMLVDAPRNETTGFASWYAALWLEEPITLRAFTSLLGADRFFNVPAADTLEALLAESAGNQQEVTDQLGYQVRRAVEVLVQSLDRADQDAGRTLLAAVDEKSIYAGALTVMMRLVFLFSAEERGLLLLHDELYAAHYAVSTLREQLRHAADQHGEEILERRRDAWSRLLATFRAVFGGLRHDRLTLPAYGGNLFDPDRYPFLEGRAAGTNWRDTPADPLPIHNRTVLHLLDALQMLEVKAPGGERQARRLSFRALDIEQIGHVYEGLLDHTARRAGAGEPVLGLKGTRTKEPEIRLATLEQLRAKNDGDVALVESLREETGRSASALKRDLFAGGSAPTLLDTEETNRLRTACGQDEALFQRVLPYMGLIRSDTFEYPLVVQPGSLYVTAGSDRRSTGTHYTPRSLTEPIVRYTLEPLVYFGPAEGWPRENWQLKTPRELLALKVCDLAMGSGAFLVAACRYLAARLVDAWSEVERANPESFITSPEGDVSTGNPEEALIVRLPDDERLHLAMRAVADRCLYGVDINPMAVEMAKLSLWLITVDSKRPFTFLDHALKGGDSLLGVSDARQLERFSLREADAAQPLFDTANLWRHVEQAAIIRRQLGALPSHTASQIDEKTRLHREAETALAKLRAAADFLIAAELDTAGDRGWDTRRAIAASHMQAGWEKDLDEFQRLAYAELRGRRPFHWPLEFPEVFEAGKDGKHFAGFDAFIGNPPFLGGARISGTSGDDYLHYLLKANEDSIGNADLCSYFVRRVFLLLDIEKVAGMLTTNSIAKGETRESGLEYLLKNACTLFRATKSRTWPGTANVFISELHLRKGSWAGEAILDGVRVEQISSFLDSHGAEFTNHRLSENIGVVFRGPTVGGEGFVLSAQEREEIIAHSPEEGILIRQFLTGQDINQNPRQSSDRWVIDLGDRSEAEARQFKHSWQRLYSTVRIQRENNKIKGRAEMWWRFIGRQEKLYQAIHGFERVLACGEVSKYWGAAWVEPDQVFAGKVVVFALRTDADFALLNSCCHTEWAEKTASRLKEDPSYSLANTFETLAFPGAMLRKKMGKDLHSEDANMLAVLDQLGKRYHLHRKQLMQTRGEGLTKTYNRFHDPSETSMDIVDLRTLHRQLDTAVTAAYGWAELAANDGIALGHGFHETKQGTRYTLAITARHEILDRLLALNHRRHSEEIAAGLHGKQKSKPRSSTRKSKNVLIGKQAMLELDSILSSDPPPPLGSRISAPPKSFAINLVRALLEQGGGSLALATLIDAFVLATQPTSMLHVALPEDADIVSSWAKRWNEGVSPLKFLPAIQELGSRNLMLIDGPNGPIVSLVSDPASHLPNECVYDAWLALRVVKVLAHSSIVLENIPCSVEDVRNAVTKYTF